MVSKGLLFTKKLIRPTFSYFTHQPSLQSFSTYNRLIHNPQLSSQPTSFIQTFQRPFSNYVIPNDQIKIKHNSNADDLASLKQILPPDSSKKPVCTFEHEAPVVQRKEAKASRFNIRYSSTKLNACAMFIRNRHVYDALHNITIPLKKGANIVRDLLESAQKNAVDQGMDETRLWVKEVIIGRRLGQRKIDIKARGKFGFRRKCLSSLKIKVEELTLGDFFKLYIKGECPPSIGTIFRTQLVHSNADFDKVQKVVHLTTSKGRYYRRRQFERLVKMVKKQYQKKGINLKAEKIERNLLKKGADEYQRAADEMIAHTTIVQRDRRMAHYEKNFKKK